MSLTKVTTAATVAFGPGAVLLLADEQVAPRRHLFESLGGKRYRALAGVEFKAGERIGIEGEIAKGLRPSLLIPPRSEAKPAGE